MSGPRGGTIRHNAVSAPYQPKRNSIVQLRKWAHGGNDLVTAHAKEHGDSMYVAEVGEPVHIVGAHARALYRTIDPRFTHSLKAPLSEHIGDASLPVTINNGRYRFHDRLNTLAYYRLPSAYIAGTLNGNADELDWNEHAANLAAVRALRAITGNPYGVESELGVSRQTCLLYLYFGHVIHCRNQETL